MGLSTILVIVAIGIACLGASIVRMHMKEKTLRRFSVYYGDSNDRSSFEDDGIIILAENTPLPVREWVLQGKIVAGYLSVGQINSVQTENKPYLGRPWVLAADKHWPEARTVDVRSEEWQRVLLEQRIPDLIKHGFNAVFLDTLDQSIVLELQNNQVYAGTLDALVQLIMKMKKKYPHLKIITNNAFELLPKVYQKVDAFLFESVVSAYDFSQQHYRMATQDDRLQRVQRLADALGIEPLILEYGRSEEDFRRISKRLPLWPLTMTTINLRDLSARRR